MRRKLTEAREFVKNPPPKPFPWFWVAIGVTLVSMGGFGGQWLHRWNKNRYRVQPFEVVRMIEAGKSPTILDARKSDSYEQLPLKIPGSIRVVPEDLANSMAGLDLDPARPVIAYCSSPDEETSARVARDLRKTGFKDVRILKGGLGAWTNAGLPIETRSDLSQVGLELYKAWRRQRLTPTPHPALSLRERGMRRKALEPQRPSSARGSDPPTRPPASGSTRCRARARKASLSTDRDLVPRAASSAASSGGSVLQAGARDAVPTCARRASAGLRSQPAGRAAGTGGG